MFLLLLKEKEKEKKNQLTFLTFCKPQQDSSRTMKPFQNILHKPFFSTPELYY